MAPFILIAKLNNTTLGIMPMPVDNIVKKIPRSECIIMRLIASHQPIIKIIRIFFQSQEIFTAGPRAFCSIGFKPCCHFARYW
jgi:hypothetical protein